MVLRLSARISARKSEIKKETLMISTEMSRQIKKRFRPEKISSKKEFQIMRFGIIYILAQILFFGDLL